MESLKQYDPYNIKQIQFYLNKKPKFTTLKSILASLAILTLALIISFESLQQIWIPKGQLDILSSQRRLSQISLTSTPFCLISKNSSHIIPQATVQNLQFKNNTSTILKNFQATDIYDNNKQILQLKGDKNIRCYNLEGTLLTPQLYLRIQIQQQVNFIIGTTSIDQIINNQHGFIYKDTTGYGLQAHYAFYFQKMKGQLFNQLLVQYQPENYVGLSSENVFLLRQSITQYKMQISIYSQRYNQLTKEITIKRQNIGQILGKFFSWLTILTIIFTCFISSIVQQNFKINLAQSIYDHKYLSNIHISLLTYLKYSLSHFKSGLYEQEILNVAFNKLEADLNILNLVKRQVVMKKMISQNQSIGKNKQLQIAQNKQLSQNSQLLDNFAISQFKTQDIDDDIVEQEIFEFDIQFEQQSNNFVEQSIKGLDIGQTTISLISNKGQGYSTSWNTILSVFFFILVFSFLIFAGFFQIDADTSVSTLLQGKNQLDHIVIEPSDLMIRAQYTSMFDDFILNVQLRNENYQLLKTITLLSGTPCNSYALALNLPINSGWKCLPQAITLKNNGKNSKILLHLSLYFPGFFAFTASPIEVAFKQISYQNEQFVQQVKIISNYFASDVLKVVPVQVLAYQGQDQQSNYRTTYTVIERKAISINGVGFQLMQQIQNIQKKKTSIWDIIDNSWGIFILCFTIILSKITRYMNVKYRQKITSSTQNQSRNDIVSIISMQYKLGSKVFKKELNSIKYFYKSKISMTKDLND